MGPYLVTPKESIPFFSSCPAPVGEELLSRSDTANAKSKKKKKFLTSMPHARTWPAFFLASGQSSAVPVAL